MTPHPKPPPLPRFLFPSGSSSSCLCPRQPPSSWSEGQYPAHVTAFTLQNFPSEIHPCPFGPRRCPALTKSCGCGLSAFLFHGPLHCLHVVLSPNCGILAIPSQTDSPSPTVALLAPYMAPVSPAHCLCHATPQLKASKASLGSTSCIKCAFFWTQRTHASLFSTTTSFYLPSFLCLTCSHQPRPGCHSHPSEAPLPSQPGSHRSRQASSPPRRPGQSLQQLLHSSLLPLIHHPHCKPVSDLSKTYT